VDMAISKFGSIDALVNNAGIYFSKTFIEYTIDDLRALTAVNIDGLLFISQLAIWPRNPAAASSISHRQWRATRSPEPIHQFR
jgi:NADP-dependent 3-hydroxy acid dehydrogenase YdfG